jgi:heme oxygenase
MRYFSGYAEKTMTHWQAFWAFVEMACPAQAGEDACESAVATFRLIKQHLDEARTELMAVNVS